MPGAIADPVSVGVFPKSLSTKFVSQHKYETRMAEYHDGTTERASLVGQSRRTWTATKRLTAAQTTTLRNWFDAHPADAFYFYDLRETSPPNTWDATGTATAGRYTVRFNSDWSQTMGIPRNDIPVELIEVGLGGGVITGGGGGGGGYPHGLPVSGVTFVVTSHTPGSFTGLAACNFGAGINLYDPTSYSYRTDNISSWDDVSKRWSVSVAPYVTLTDPIAASLTFWIDGSVFASSSPPDIMKIHDCWMEITYADGAVITYRPTVATAIAAGAGTITNPTHAISGSPTSYCEIHRSSFGGSSGAGCQLVLSHFA